MVSFETISWFQAQHENRESFRKIKRKLKSDRRKYRKRID